MKKLILSLTVLMFMGSLSLKAQVRVTVLRTPYKKAVIASPVLVSPVRRVLPAPVRIVSFPARRIVAPSVVVVRPPVAIVRPLPVVRRRVSIYH